MTNDKNPEGGLEGRLKKWEARRDEEKPTEEEREGTNSDEIILGNSVKGNW